MTPTLRSLATIAFVAASLAPFNGHAAQNNGIEPSVGDVCLIGFEVCSAGCNATNPDSGLDFNEYISNQLCMRQCVDQLNACIASAGDGGSPARKLSVRKINTAGFDFKGDGTPNQNPTRPSGGTDRPADPTGGKPDGGFTFNPGALMGGPATTIIQ